MTLTPAIKEARDAYETAVYAAKVWPESISHANRVSSAWDTLLSVVAAEEGRKYEGKIYTKEDAEALCEVTRAAIVQHYEELVKLHREWVEARKSSHTKGDIARQYAAEDALAQWEAK